MEWEIILISVFCTAGKLYFLFICISIWFITNFGSEKSLVDGRKDYNQLQTNFLICLTFEYAFWFWIFCIMDLAKLDYGKGEK